LDGGGGGGRGASLLLLLLLIPGGGGGGGGGALAASQRVVARMEFEFGNKAENCEIERGMLPADCVAVVVVVVDVVCLDPALPIV